MSSLYIYAIAAAYLVGCIGGVIAGAVGAFVFTLLAARTVRRWHDGKA